MIVKGCDLDCECTRIWDRNMDNSFMQTISEEDVSEPKSSIRLSEGYK